MTASSSPQAQLGLKLNLADGQQWVICPVDNRSASIVAELGQVMRLGAGRVGRELWAAVCEEPDESDWAHTEAAGAVVCRLAVPTDRETHVSQMQRVASVIAHDALARGGLLLHAALAEYHESGFIMAAPSETGKSTASCRLPSPWRPLCDDQTLVVRDREGRFWAHPWPTWSSFRNAGSGGSWAVEHAVPLRAVFFLMRSSSDQLEPVTATQTAALIVESAMNLRRTEPRLTDKDASLAFRSEGLRAAQALASAVPAYSLKLSLDGRFWENIERVLPTEALQEPCENGQDWSPVSVESLAARSSLRMVYTGTSMSPTFRVPDLLEVKPYGLEPVRPGDVVCFKSPGTGTKVAHRVVSVRPDAIRTRGDNSQNDDPWVLQQHSIIGRVVAAQREARRRVVHGGWKGPLVLRCTRLGRGIRECIGRLPHELSSMISGLGPLDRLLPASLRPKLVRFYAPYWSRDTQSGLRYRGFLKLLMGRHTVGRYDGRRERWYIQQPFRLFVDEQTLIQTFSLVLRNEVWS